MRKAKASKPKSTAKPKKPKANSKKSEGKKKAPKKSAKKSPKKAPKSKRAAKVDEHADTIIDTQRPVPGQRPRPEKKRSWRWADLLLTGVFVLLLALTISGIWVVNRWSIQQGATSVHALSIAHISERTRAYILYLKMQYGPPPRKRPSLGYEKEIQAAALKYRVPANLLKAVIKVGTGFHPHHVDRFGAVGLMQLTPSLGMSMAKQPGKLFDPITNIHAGARYLRRQLDRKKGMKQAVTAYYASIRKLRGQKTSGPQHHFAWQVMRAYRQFQKDPGLEIRRASKRNQHPTKKRRSWLSWKRLKALVKRQ